MGGLGTLWLIVGLALVVTAAWLLAASLRLTDTIDFLLALYLFAVSAIVVVALALSPFRALTRGGILAASAVLVIVAATAWLLRQRPPSPSLRHASQIALEALRDPPIAILAVGVGLALAYSAALAVGTTETSYDANWYHLARAAFWRQQHAVGYIAQANNPRLNAFPPGAEIVFAWTMTLSGSGRFAALFQLVALLAMMLAIAGIGLRLGLGRRAAAFGALLFASLPVVLLQAPAALNDLAVASFLVIVVSFLLSDARGALALGALSLALAVATKYTGALAIPLLLVVAAVLTPRRRWPRIAVAGAAAILVGGFWYAVNLRETGRLLPHLDLVSASSSHSSAAVEVPALLARLAIDAVDPAGFVGRDRYLFAAAAAALLAIGLWAARHSGSRATAAGAVFAAVIVLVPLAYPTAYDDLLRAYQHVLLQRGQRALAFTSWDRDPVQPSSVKSWYGPLGLLALLGTLPLAVRQIRRGRLRKGALVLLLAPVLYVVVVVVRISYSPYHGRYLMPAVALAAATWGLLHSVRPIAWAATAIATVAIALVLVHNGEKPAGFALLGGKAQLSVWTQSRTDALAKAGPVRAVERHVARGTTVGLRVGAYDVSYPYFGAGLDRRVVFVGASGAGLSRRVDWLVVGTGLSLPACADGWRLVPSGEPGWRMYRRVGTCTGESTK
jgi:hypothetical protein